MDNVQWTFVWASDSDDFTRALYTQTSFDDAHLFGCALPAF
jgi:hypothetical protein